MSLRFRILILRSRQSWRWGRIDFPGDAPPQPTKHSPNIVSTDRRANHTELPFLNSVGSRSQTYTSNDDAWNCAPNSKWWSHELPRDTSHDPTPSHPRALPRPMRLSARPDYRCTLRPGMVPGSAVRLPTGLQAVHQDLQSSGRGWDHRGFHQGDLGGHGLARQPEQGAAGGSQRRGPHDGVQHHWWRPPARQLPVHHHRARGELCRTGRWSWREW